MKTKLLALVAGLHTSLACPQESCVIVYGLLAALLLLIGVSMISAIAASHGRRR